jgi:hypothetical protein
MNKYKIGYMYADGFEGEVEVQADNRHEALEAFESFASEDIISTECTRIDEYEEEI